MRMKALLTITIFIIFSMIAYYPTTAQEAGDQSPISFTDTNLERAIRDILDKPEGDIFGDDFTGMKELSLTNEGIKDISDLYYADLTSIEVLDLTSNEITDLSPLPELILPSLRRLILDHNLISDIEVFAIADLPALRRLSINYNQLKDVTPLINFYDKMSEGLTDEDNLVITVSDNNMDIQDGTENRETVKYLQSNGVWMSWGFGNNTGESPLVFTDYKLENAVRYAIGKSFGEVYPFELSNLKKLEVLKQQVIDISALYEADLYSLEFMSFYRNRIRDISGFADVDFPSLKLLYISYNQIKDITVLKDMYENGAFRESSGRQFDIYMTYNNMDFIPEKNSQPVEEPEDQTNNNQSQNDNDTPSDDGTQEEQEEHRDIGRENLDTLIFLESKGLKIKWRDGNKYSF
jgi:Leucine-rich repeat (LRR) protein